MQNDNCAGEDIAMSDGEGEEEGGNELEYDDFFLQDNDFGSDADSDGEIMAAVAMKSREGEEKVGPRFIRSHCSVPVTNTSSSSLPRVAFKHDDTTDSDLSGLAREFKLVSCDSREKDTIRLGSYCAVVHTNLLPYLGAKKSTAEAGSSSSSGSKKKIAASTTSAELTQPDSVVDKKSKGFDSSNVSIKQHYFICQLDVVLIRLDVFLLSCITWFGLCMVRRTVLTRLLPVFKLSIQRWPKIFQSMKRERECWK